MENPSPNIPLILVEGSASDGNLKIHKKNVEKLLNTTGDRPLSVISITGPPKTGKTILFNYMARWLIAAEKNLADWMDNNFPEENLHETSWPLTGKSPDTQAILGYHRAFLMDDQNIAVLLLYIQSSKTSNWDKDCTEANAIMGLTLQISSHIIFNAHKRLDEDYLQAVGAHIKQALSNTPSTSSHANMKPFQNAYFLIRDWDFPSENHFGNSDDNNYVKQGKFREHPKQSLTSRESRKLINGLFENISIFLLPFPGHEEVASEEFQSSRIPIDWAFSKHLDTFIQTSTNVDEIVLKRNLRGDEITGAMLFELIQSYVKRYQGDVEIDSAPIIRRYGLKYVRLENEQLRLIKPAMQTYASLWQKHLKKLGDYSTLDALNLRSFDTRAQRQAMNVVNDQLARLYGKRQEGDFSDEDDGEEEMESSVKQKLGNRMKRYFLRIQEEVEKKQIEILKGLKEDAVNRYIDTLRRRIERQARPTERYFRKQSRSLMELINREFLENIGNFGEKGLEEAENVRRELEEKEQSLFAEFMEDFDVNPGFQQGHNGASSNSIHSSIYSDFDSYASSVSINRGGGSRLRLNKAFSKSAVNLDPRQSNESFEDRNSRSSQENEMGKSYGRVPETSSSSPKPPVPKPRRLMKK